VRRLVIVVVSDVSIAAGWKEEMGSIASLMPVNSGKPAEVAIEDKMR
jgi:hypothetical protein